LASPPGSAPGLVLLLLDLLLVACPSPPGLDLELRFISKVLLDDYYGICGAVKELWCSLCWFPAGRMGAGCSGHAHLASCCGAASTASQSYDWAACVLCACFPHCAWSHPSTGRVVHLLGTQMLCTQVNKMNRYYTWSFVLNDAIGNIIAQCLRVTPSNPNISPIWSLSVLQVRVSRFKWRHLKILR
jgi:hypothetical protein